MTGQSHSHCSRHIIMVCTY